ncbi:hypothetical protein PDJAM_G00050060 [Pangasius djambal]|uniref:Uncharacterized protein n=1 Tax=Pangasius djambal TaxID=1691987 RepID=A0ACC5YWI2_9TELE|nr:hypothetical protein [Pangasius djambal]
MFGRSRGWVGGQGKSKNIHSLDHLKYMYHVLTKNTTVTDHNRNLLVETIRSITEILIWGDQNDSSVFDLFNPINRVSVLPSSVSGDSCVPYSIPVSLDNQHMLHYIRDKTAVPYFSNLVWFIGSHVIELDKCVQTDEEHKNRGKLSDLVAEHLDHLHYLNDILIINCEFLNDVLTDHLLNRLFLPLYVYSLVGQEQSEDRKINPQVSLYLLSQVFLIIHYQPLVNALADVILNGDLTVFTTQTEQNTHKSSSNSGVRRFTKPPESLERSLEMSRHRGRKKTQKRPNYKNVGEEDEEERGAEEGADEEKEKAKGTEASSKASRTSGDTEEIEMVVMEKCKISDASTLTEQNITDEEKTAAAAAGTEAQKSRYNPRVAGEDPAAGSRSGEEQLQSCSGGETDQSHEPCCSARREGALGHSGAELSSPEAVGAVRGSVHHQGRPSGLPGGTRPPEALSGDTGTRRSRVSE